MELLPILATIILVLTIATLILAVAAYVLYKLREKKGRSTASYASQAAQTQQQHVLTTPMNHAYAQPLQAPVQQPVHRETVVRERHVERQPEPQATYVPPAGYAAQAPRQAAPAPAVSAHQVETNTFWEYTGEGYVPADRNQQDNGSAWL